MKYKPTVALSLIFVVVGLVVKGQRNTTDFGEIGIQDSIRKIVIDFGKAVDLFNDPEVYDYEGAANRENSAGYKMFNNLFDTVNFPENLINFIDPRYINTMIEVQNCKSQDCINELFAELEKNKDYNNYLSVKEYVTIYRNIYLTDGISSSILEGAGAMVDSSQIIWNGKIKKSFGNRYKAIVSAPFSFWGVYLNETGKQTSINVENINFIFQISFDKVKSGDHTFYVNFKIDRVFDYVQIPPKVYSNYKFTLTPIVGVGIQTISSSFNNNDINKAFIANNSQNIETGVLIERKFKPFERNYLDLVLGTGVNIKLSNINSSLSDGYSESNSNATPPFAPSETLSNYWLDSELTGTEFADRHWFLGVPFKIGIGFPLNKENALRGYFNTGFSYQIPLSTTNTGSGVVDYAGRFIYVNDGAETQIVMSGENNPFPESYGKKDAYSNSSTDLKNGYEVKTQLGVSVPLKGENYLNVGSYFVFGTLKTKNEILTHLVEAGGVIHSPIRAMEELKYIGYGITLSVSFDFYKLESQK